MHPTQLGRRQPAITAPTARRVWTSQRLATAACCRLPANASARGRSPPRPPRVDWDEPRDRVLNLTRFGGPSGTQLELPAVAAPGEVNEVPRPGRGKFATNRAAWPRVPVASSPGLRAEVSYGMLHRRLSLPSWVAAPSAVAWQAHQQRAGVSLRGATEGRVPL